MRILNGAKPIPAIQARDLLAVAGGAGKLVANDAVAGTGVKSDGEDQAKDR